jgi:hypothetical protein
LETVKSLAAVVTDLSDVTKVWEAYEEAEAELLRKTAVTTGSLRTYLQID